MKWALIAAAALAAFVGLVFAAAVLMAAARDWARSQDLGGGHLGDGR